MSTFIDADDLPATTCEALAEVHAKETKDLVAEVNEMLSKCSKKDKKAYEARSVAMQSDLQMKQQDEEDLLEEYLEQQAGAVGEDKEASSGDASAKKEGEKDDGDAPVAPSTSSDSPDKGLSKQEKARRKREKKKEKETAIAHAKEVAKNDPNRGPSMRDIELGRINDSLLEYQLQVKEIASDGNCLYRAISDQLRLIADSVPVHSSSSSPSTASPLSVSIPRKSFAELREMAATYMRSHRDDFMPFMDIDGEQGYEAYCVKVGNSVGTVEWGGQLEIRALSNALGYPIEVFEDGNVVRMEDLDPGVGAMSALIPLERDKELAPIRLTYHRHYLALGEHYNSVAEIPVDPGSIKVTHHKQHRKKEALAETDEKEV